jgi:glycosyltransferase involved in cell wall biosynthesis
VRSAFLSWARPHYDFAWVGRGHGFVPLDGCIDAPTIVDFDDLEDRKIGAWLDIASDAKRQAEGIQHKRGPQALARSWGSRVVNMANRRRWRALQHRIASRVDTVVVCSALDKERLNVPNSVVIPNGYAQPERPAGRDAPGDPPTIVLGGALAYAPNADAARFLAKEILPRIRARINGTQLRLVGRYDDRISELANIDGVTLTGFVPDMAVELARADMVAVPVRFGSGTRVKILEAFAHRIPVVASTLGCEGIDVVDSRHLLIADDAERFASACTRLLVDLRLRRQLTAAAHELYLQRHRWETITPTVVAAAREAICRSRAGSSPIIAKHSSVFEHGA